MVPYPSHTDGRYLQIQRAPQRPPALLFRSLACIRAGGPFTKFSINRAWYVINLVGSSCTGRAITPENLKQIKIFIYENKYGFGFFPNRKI
eukprot:SAG31_NODE_3395_length_4320_cov_14.336413_1_plen_91_part_00